MSRSVPTHPPTARSAAKKFWVGTIVFWRFKTVSDGFRSKFSDRPTQQREGIDFGPTRPTDPLFGRSDTQITLSTSHRHSVAFQSCSAVFESYYVKNLDRDTIGTDTRPMATRPLARAVANDWPAVCEVRRRLQAYRAETISTDPLSLSGALICLLHLCSSCLHSPLTGPDITPSPIRPLQTSTLAPIHPTGTTTTSHLRSFTTDHAQLVTANSFRRAGRRTCIMFLLRTAPVSLPAIPACAGAISSCLLALFRPPTEQPPPSTHPPHIIPWTHAFPVSCLVLPGVRPPSTVFLMFSSHDEI